MNRHYILLTAVVILSLLTAFLSNDLYLPAMPVLQKHFSTTANLMQTTEGVWFAGSMMLQLFVGPLSDAYGRRPTLVGSLTILVIGSLVCAISPNIWVFILGRFIQGMASSGIMAVSFAAVHESAPNDKEATKMLGLVSMITTAAPISGPLLGGYIAQYFGWQWTFYIVIVLALGSMAACHYMLRDGKQTPGKLDWRNSLAHYKALCNNTAYMTSVASYAFMFFAIGAFLSGLPFVMVDILGFSVQHVGYALVPLLIIYMIATGVTGSISTLVRPTMIIASALLLAFTIMSCFTVASLELAPTLTLLITCMAGFYLGFGISGPHLNNISLGCASAGNKGSGSALLTMSMMFASTLGSFTMGYVYNHKLWSLAFLLTIAVTLALASYVFYHVTRDQHKTQKVTTYG